MYKKARCTCKVVVLLLEPFVFLTFSLPSASLDLKVLILAGQRDSRHYSTTCFTANVLVEESSYQLLEVLTFCDREGTQIPSIKITALTFLLKKKVQ